MKKKNGVRSCNQAYVVLQDLTPNTSEQKNTEEVAMAKKGFIPQKVRPWIEARKKYKLSHAHIQMARELGLNPKKFGSLANHKQEPWKAPLPAFIEDIYEKRFGKSQPDDIRSIEVKLKEKAKNKEKKKAVKQALTEVSTNIT